MSAWRGRSSRSKRQILSAIGAPSRAVISAPNWATGISKARGTSSGTCLFVCGQNDGLRSTTQSNTSHDERQPANRAPSLRASRERADRARAVTGDGSVEISVSDTGVGIAPGEIIWSLWPDLKPKPQAEESRPHPAEQPGQGSLGRPAHPAGDDLYVFPHQLRGGDRFRDETGQVWEGRRLRLTTRRPRHYSHGQETERVALVRLERIYSKFLATRTTRPA